jgi:hypothetical protein
MATIAYPIAWKIASPIPGAGNVRFPANKMSVVIPSPAIFFGATVRNERGRKGSRVDRHSPREITQLLTGHVLLQGGRRFRR